VQCWQAFCFRNVLNTQQSFSSVRAECKRLYYLVYLFRFTLSPIFLSTAHHLKKQLNYSKCLQSVHGILWIDRITLCMPVYASYFIWYYIHVTGRVMDGYSKFSIFQFHLNLFIFTFYFYMTRGDINIISCWRINKIRRSIMINTHIMRYSYMSKKISTAYPLVGIYKGIEGLIDGVKNKRCDIRREN
jgi:hypothetical protein